MGEVVLFLLSAVVISLSGVMAPGAVTAATIAHGVGAKNAGALIAVGHGLIEFPLMIFIFLGFDRLIRSDTARISIGLAGAAFLLWMGVQMLRGLSAPGYSSGRSCRAGPILTGFILSVSNPYFLLWWATIGLKLSTDARRLGSVAFILFAVIHWLCDLVWLEALSLASFKGAMLVGVRRLRIILGICAIAMIFFAAGFAYDAVKLWMGSGI